jgi:hypothetical protein
MKKITGIKSVDFKITAEGYGVVNWNGSTLIRAEGREKDDNNHTMPKLRGYTNLTGKESDKGFKFKKSPIDVDFKKTPLYISQNCIRHHLFRHERYNLNSVTDNAMLEQLICSLTGLIRGYVANKIKSEPKRTSPLLITDFIELQGNGNFEQMSRSGKKEKEKTKSGVDKGNSLFSKTTFGDTKYEAYGSISIELLQFIPLSADFGRPSMIIDNDNHGIELAEKITNFLKSFAENPDEIKAVYHKNYVRKGSIFNEGEAGILLNDQAINVLVEQTKSLLKNLKITQAKGMMWVSEVEFDYNDSSIAKDMLRIKTGGSTNPNKSVNYAIYYEGK